MILIYLIPALFYIGVMASGFWIGRYLVGRIIFSMVAMVYGVHKLRASWVSWQIILSAHASNPVNSFFTHGAQLNLYTGLLFILPALALLILPKRVRHYYWFVLLFCCLLPFLMPSSITNGKTVNYPQPLEPVIPVMDPNIPFLAPASPLITLSVQDEAGNPLPQIKVERTWRSQRGPVIKENSQFTERETLFTGDKGTVVFPLVEDPPAGDAIRESRTTVLNNHVQTSLHVYIPAELELNIDPEKFQQIGRSHNYKDPKIGVILDISQAYLYERSTTTALKGWTVARLSFGVNYLSKMTDAPDQSRTFNYTLTISKKKPPTPAQTFKTLKDKVAAFFYF